MQLSDDEIWSLCKLGHQLYSRERYDDAERIFSGLVALDETLGYPWHALGMIARNRGDARRAADCFQRRLDLEPGADDSRVALAETLHGAGRVREAADLLRPFERDPEDDSPAARRGRVLLERWTKSNV